MSIVTTDPQTLRCPTCGADQTASAECRRCKCDLTLVLAVRQQAQVLHEQVLRHLRDGRAGDAVDAAERRHTLSPDRTSRRLLAVSYVTAGNYEAAIRCREIP